MQSLLQNLSVYAIVCFCRAIGGQIVQVSGCTDKPLFCTTAKSGKEKGCCSIAPPEDLPDVIKYCHKSAQNHCQWSVIGDKKFPVYVPNYTVRAAATTESCRLVANTVLIDVAYATDVHGSYVSAGQLTSPGNTARQCKYLRVVQVISSLLLLAPTYWLDSYILCSQGQLQHKTRMKAC